MGWVSFIFFGYDLSRDAFSLGKMGLLLAAVPLVALAVAKVTNRILAQPLWQLQKGITSVREGRLDPIAVSHTGDEVEYLGESLNAMIAALKESKEEVRQYQETLRDKIQQRTEALEEATESALTASKGNVAQAARSLGTSSRQLYRWLAKAGLDPERFR